MGSVNRADCWYLYTASYTDTGSKLNIAIGGRGSRALRDQLESDQTLEVLMTDLDRDKMAYFYQANCGSAAEATKVNVGRRAGALLA